MSSLQEKYNDFMDAGGHAVSFYAKNNLLNDDKKSKKTRQELKDNYQKLQEKRQTDPKERLKIIRKRLENYGQHKNDPYAYSRGEIDEVRTLLQYAPADIEFLLNLTDKLDKDIEELKNFIYALGRGQAQLDLDKKSKK